jgi:hypothetical protein
MLSLNKILFGFLDFVIPKFLATAAAVVGIVGGISQMAGSSGGGGGGGGGAGSADPFASQRGQYQQQLSQLMSSPGAFASSPLFQFAMQQGLQGVNRSDAARGMLGSGNRLMDIMSYGQGQAGQLYNQQAQLLAQLAGATSGSPAAAAQLAAQQQQQGLSNIAGGLGGLANVYPTSSTTDTTGMGVGGMDAGAFGPTQSAYGSNFTVPVGGY